MKSKHADLYDLIESAIPDDHSRQVNSDYFLKNSINKKGMKVMDIGCGKGDSIDYFFSIDPSVNWVGVDIDSSPEVSLRTRTDARFVVFDGVNLPFPDESFNVIYSKQVFEHVKDPKGLIAEISRVLKKGEIFTGSVSYLEPYHSFSIWNYTPYGFKILIEEANLKLEQIRPGIDALTLIIRSIFGRKAFFNRFWINQSPLNSIIGFFGAIKKKSNKIINYAKLMFCGQFVFIAKKPES